MSNQSADEFFSWRALTVHLVTKDNEDFEKQVEKDTQKLANNLYEQLSLLGGAGPRATPKALHDLVSHVARLGHEVAQLPYSIELMDIEPGNEFVAEVMEPMESETDPEMLEMQKTKLQIVLSKPIIKMEFDSEGELVENKKPKVMAKATVVC